FLLLGGIRVALRASEIFVVSAVMQLALALPMAVYFHRAVALGLPANVLAVPLAGVLLPAAAAALALSFVWLRLAAIPAAIAAATLHAITSALGWFSSFRAADIRVAMPTTLTAAAAVLAFVFCAWAARQRRVLAIAGMLVLVASAAWLVVPRASDIRAGVLEFTALDVGQGDALLIVTPLGKTLLVDAGGATGFARSEFDYGEEVVSPYLWERGLARLDAVALSHAHQDHIGGLRAIIANFRPRELWLGREPNIAAFRELLAEAGVHGTRVVQRAAGEQFKFGGTQIDVLAPAADANVTDRARNNDSLVLCVRYGEQAVLLPGDVERPVERALATMPLRADVLKVPHHGSATSTGDGLLSAVQPRYALISAGDRNPFGHPRPE